MSTPPPPPRRIAVVGTGPAAVSTCDALRAQGYDGQVVLYGAEHGLPYDRPPLSKDVLLGKARRADILLRPEGWYEEQRVQLRDGTRVRAIRPRAGGVELADGTIAEADRIVLATGGTPRPLPVPGGDDPAVHQVRTWEDADRLRERLLPGARVIVVGAGLIGAETAAVAVSLGCRVTLVDPVPVPLAAAVGGDIAGALHRRHTAEGVEVLTAGVAHVERSPRGCAWASPGTAAPWPRTSWWPASESARPPTRPRRPGCASTTASSSTPGRARPTPRLRRRRRGPPRRPPGTARTLGGRPTGR